MTLHEEDVQVFNFQKLLFSSEVSLEINWIISVSETMKE